MCAIAQKPCTQSQRLRGRDLLSYLCLLGSSDESFLAESQPDQHKASVSSLSILTKQYLKCFCCLWLGSSVVPIYQVCGFYTLSGYVQESTNECINKWNNKSMFLSFSLYTPSPLSLKSMMTMMMTMMIIIIIKICLC